MNAIDHTQTSQISVPRTRQSNEKTSNESIEAKLDRASQIVEAKIEARRQAAKTEALELGRAIGAAHQLDEDRVASLIADPFPME